MKQLIWLPLLLIVMSIPMIAKVVPPNRFFGFRTSQTLRNSEVWYKANQIAGVDLLVASLLTIGVWLILPNVATFKRPNPLIYVVVFTVCQTSAVLLALFQIRHLK